MREICKRAREREREKLTCHGVRWWWLMIMTLRLYNLLCQGDFSFEKLLPNVWICQSTTRLITLRTNLLAVALYCHENFFFYQNSSSVSAELDFAKKRDTFLTVYTRVCEKFPQNQTYEEDLAHKRKIFITNDANSTKHAWCMWDTYTQFT